MIHSMAVAKEFFGWNLLCNIFSLHFHFSSLVRSKAFSVARERCSHSMTLKPCRLCVSACVYRSYCSEIVHYFQCFTCSATERQQPIFTRHFCKLFRKRLSFANLSRAHTHTHSVIKFGLTLKLHTKFMIDWWFFCSRSLFTFVHANQLWLLLFRASFFAWKLYYYDYVYTVRP